MSINSELQKLDAVRDALVSSVNGKGGNLAADATLWQVKAAVDGIEVGSGEDPTPIVTQPKPTVSVNSSNGLVTAKYTPVAGKVTDTAEKSGTLQLTAQAAQTITPGTSDKTIASGRYLTGTQTIKGDANLTAGNIKNGVSIFGVAGDYKGEGGGGAGAFDLVAVTSYTPAYSKISSLTLSGMGVDEMSGYDLTKANGVYQVTSATANKSSNERVYKHTSQEYYIFYIPEDTTGMYYSYGWAFNTQVASDPWSVMMMATSSMKELAEGTSTWYGEMNMLSMSVTIGSIQQEMVAPEIKAKKVTGYNSNTLQYTFDNEEIDCSSVDSSNLQEHQIYNFNGTTIFGKPLDCEGGSHLRTYIHGRTAPVTMLLRNDRNSYTNYNYFSAWQYPTFATSSPERFSLATISGKSCIYSNTGAETITLTNADDFGSGKYGYYPSTADRKWSFGALLHSGNQKNCNQRLFCQIAKRVSIDAEWRESTPRIVVRVDDTVVITYTASGLSSGWHHVLLTYDWNSNKKLTLYVDGSARGTHSEAVSIENGFPACYFGVGRDVGEWYIGHVCEIKFWDIPLTAEQAMAEYNRAINS